MRWSGFLNVAPSGHLLAAEWMNLFSLWCAVACCTWAQRGERQRKRERERERERVVREGLKYFSLICEDASASKLINKTNETSDRSTSCSVQ